MYTSVIVAAGKGTRAGLEFNKIFYHFGNKSLIDFTIQPFVNDEDCDKIILVLSNEDLSYFKDKKLPSKVEITLGGDSRQESVMKGLEKVTSEYVMIHDGARPNLHPMLLEKCKEELLLHHALTLALPVKDSLIQGEGSLFDSLVSREDKYFLQTPQAFQTKEIKKAHQLALKEQHFYTDDASLYYQELGEKVYILSGDEQNIKATTKLDLLILEELLCTK